MELSEYVVESFHRHLDSTMQAISTLSQPLADAGDLLVHTLLNEGKILCCGEGASGLLAQHFVQTLVSRHLRDRPALPALALAHDGALLSSIAAHSSFNEIFARQVRALGQPRDCVVLITHGTGTGTALQTVLAARDRDLSVILLTNEHTSDLHALLAPDDIEIHIDGDRARFTETALLALHTLCELIELQLFGGDI